MPVINSIERELFFIDGQWRKASTSDLAPVFEAATERPLGVAAMGGPEEIDAAVHAARAALQKGPWGRSTPHERAAVMRRFADSLERRGRSTAELVSRQTGMISSLSVSTSATAPVAILRSMADLIEKRTFETRRPSSMGSTIVREEPVGVVGAITAWNYPQLLAMAKIGPALAAGCTVVLKPAPETSLDAYVLAEAAEEAGLPPGVLNIVAGGVHAGKALVAHPDVDKIAFTGSTAAGQAIGEVAGRSFKRVSLELGGKSAAIVLPDADLDVFAGGLKDAVLKNGGQTCTTNSRILVPHGRSSEIIDALASYVDGLVMGDPLDESVTMGPMVSEQHRERVRSYIRLGQSEGFRTIRGGTDSPEQCPRGWFVSPTIFEGVDNRSPLAQEEIFGPVISVIPYETEEDAINMANDTPFGLGGVVFTEDTEHGLDVASRIRSGTVGVNYYSLDTGSPFGGVKNSGVGREFGPESLDFYLEYKSIYV
ncbi:MULTISPECIES: aldehyde dehydrogenase [Rhodococcus]|uniref:aldehyde dehydrogenase n=1 Tax=Rhodococcus TaxID=1827 RepID=UPI00030DB605|nr:aldehyde dehydrogenase [Rhodococcus pyridinivorans]MCD2119392.1 aldehyde dehydrogenase [Rhodococcus pyridinivorans]MCD2143521.1 aldehyde dehydrogenase [Rhodococcus pyridinivorans]MCZ4628286.1 aldehyde dehydrogenase [Rhodococcus pyridinivorans]MCZ4649552.1 aldehyde dehydrogenase [Rhodococcus pyridinivorans]MDJ0483370.1 aldehyde dehydrogenase [Rhodococcus pyridinivorans]